MGRDKRCSMKFIIEKSQTPIYNRIAVAFTNCLIELGHTVYFIDTDDFNQVDFINTINQIDLDYYISTNENNYIQHKLENSNEFVFNRINQNIIFIHHDTLFSNSFDLLNIGNKILAYTLASAKSWHFSIEETNVTLLRDLGVEKSFKINHASEFELAPQYTENYQYNLSFVGHLMSSLRKYPFETLAGGFHLYSLANSRICNTSLKLQPKIQDLVMDEIFNKSYFSSNPTSENDAIARKYYLISALNKLSSPYRGELINLIKGWKIHIIGGDLSYGKINDPLLKIESESVEYLPATQNYSDTSGIYNRTKINLNITSLQFDSALNNRVIDIINSGGFVLTDAMTDWLAVDESCKTITYNSPEELNHLIDFFSSASNVRFYNDIKNNLFEIFSKKFTYLNQVSELLKKLR